MILLNSYIHFKNTAREAMEFYQTIFGGHLDTTTFKDGGVPSDQADGSLIMHAKLAADNGVVIMGSDTPAHMEHNPGDTITMSLSGDDEAVLRSYWDKLAVGATISQPLDKAPWGDIFGMLRDKFGVEWMIDIHPPKN